MLAYDVDIEKRLVSCGVSRESLHVIINRQ